MCLHRCINSKPSHVIKDVWSRLATSSDAEGICSLGTRTVTDSANNIARSDYIPADAVLRAVFEQRVFLRIVKVALQRHSGI